MRVDAVTDPLDSRDRVTDRRRRRIAIAQRAGWRELERRNLAFGRFGVVTDERDGTVYRVNRGEVDGQYTPIVAYYIDPNGDPVFLESKP